MPRAAKDAVLVRSGKFLRMMWGVSGHAIGIAIDRDGWNRDRRLGRKLCLDMGNRRISRHQPIAVPVGVNYDLDEIGVVEGFRRRLEGRVIEIPGRRPHSP